MQSKGGKLGPVPGKIDMQYYREQFTLLEKECEYPDMQTGENTCDALAWHVYITDWSVIYICTNHKDHLRSMNAGMMLAIDVRIAEILWAKFTRRSWRVMNDKSNGELFRRLIAQQEADEKAVARPEQRRAAEQARLKKKIAEQETKIGTPDDELLEARTGKVIPRKKANEEHEEYAKPVPTADLPLLLPKFFGGSS